MTIPIKESNSEEIEFTPMETVVEQQSQTRTPIQEGLRQIQRPLQRTGEVLFGAPGEIMNMLGGINDILEGGRKPEEALTWMQKYGRRFAEMFPDISELRARSAEVRPELEPESDVEQREDEFVQDVVTLFGPNMFGKGQALSKFGRALGTAAFGNLAAEGAKQLGVGETGQNITKMGAMLFSGMFGKGRGINTLIKNKYNQAAKAVPKGTKFQYNIDNLNKLEKSLQKGTINEAKEPVLKIIEDIRRKSPDGRMLVEEGVQFDKDINKALGRARGDKTLKGNLKQLKKTHNSSLENYAKENPTWGESWNEARELYKGIATSEDIQGYIRKNANLKNASYASLMLGMGGTYLPGGMLAKLGTAGGGAATLYASEIAKRLATNPALRRYYINVVNASLNENKGNLLRNLAGLNRTAKKEFENNPFPEFEISEEDMVED